MAQSYARVSREEPLSAQQTPPSGAAMAGLQQDKSSGASTPASFDPYQDGDGQYVLVPPMPQRFSTFSPSSSVGMGTESPRDTSVEDEGLLPHLRSGSRVSGSEGAGTPIGEKALHVRPRLRNPNV